MLVASAALGLALASLALSIAFVVRVNRMTAQVEQLLKEYN